ncbi:inactive ubiquitin carboxyl-terminal hydrolase MINDY-4B-like isoform X2 [Ptychodera flava]
MTAQESILPPGVPITIETATAIRSTLFASVQHTFDQEWRKATFTFQDMKSPCPYGIRIRKDGSRGVSYCVQAHVLKHLMFKDELQSFTSTTTTSTAQQTSKLKPTEMERSKALASAICEILWRAGEEKKAVLTLPGSHPQFRVDPKEFRTDGFLEKLMLHEFDDFQLFSTYIRRNINLFEKEDGSGVLLFIYSLILSRDIHRLVNDLEDDKLLTPYDWVSFAMVNLILTGKACPRINEGTVKLDRKGEPIGYPTPSPKGRSDIGLLFFDKEEEEKKRTRVGTMLRTPKYPIWVTHINSKVTGVMFSPSLDLMSDWRREHRFTLYYYTGLHMVRHDGPVEHAKLTIDTREKTGISFTTKKSHEDKEKNMPVLERVIYTKWPGAEIDWHGMMPFV